MRLPNLSLLSAGMVTHFAKRIMPWEAKQIMAKKKEFEDKRKTKKEKALLKKANRQVKKALKNHELGWETRDGKRF